MNSAKSGLRRERETDRDKENLKGQRYKEKKESHILKYINVNVLYGGRGTNILNKYCTNTLFKSKKIVDFK